MFSAQFLDYAGAMYIASRFWVEPEEALRQAARIGVGNLITHGERGLDATLLPFNLATAADGTPVLHAHCGKVNPQWQDEGECLMVVTGPNAYISTADMPPAALHSRLARVPTWNYVTVHLRGQLIAHHDAEWKLRTLGELLAAHEPNWEPGRELIPGLNLGTVLEASRKPGREQSQGPSREKLPPMLRALVGLEIRITSVEGKAKLSQNLGAAEIRHTAQSLRARSAEGGKDAPSAPSTPSAPSADNEPSTSSAGSAPGVPEDSETVPGHGDYYPAYSDPWARAQAGYVADLMERIAVPWAENREGRVEDATQKHAERMAAWRESTPYGGEDGLTARDIAEAIQADYERE